MKSSERAKLRASSADRIIISLKSNQNRAATLDPPSPAFRVTSSSAFGRPASKSRGPIDRQQPVIMTSTRTNIIKAATQLRPLIVIPILLLLIGLQQPPGSSCVSVQRLNVPDLVVIEQQLSLLEPARRRASSPNEPEAASLVKEPVGEITFECLVSFDRRKDKNLIVKWHHDDRIEPIYQWIPELNKRSVAPQYRAFIAPIVGQSEPAANGSAGGSLEAGFRLVRPSKELGGKYTCSAISAQNDDSKWKKMIVYTPPRTFSLNATRTDIEAQLASQRDRLIQLSQPAGPPGPPTTQVAANQLPLAYRMRGLDNHHPPPTTISPQMYSTIDYVNLNQRPPVSSSWLTGPPTPPPHPASRGVAGPQPANRPQPNGVRLVCDIDQVFPVPEVSIYRLAKLDGSHPDKLAKLDTRIERNPQTGLFHVQVISILDDQELQLKYGHNEPVYFECLIALTNLELSKYADNKRSIVYRPALLAGNNQQQQQQGIQSSEDASYESQAANAAHHLGPDMNHKLFILLLLTFTSYSVFVIRRPAR